MKYVDPVITERYARALFQAAKRLNAVAQIRNDVAILEGLTGLRGKLQVFLDSPAITTEAKQALIDKALKPHVCPLLYRLLVLLLQKGRMEYLQAILHRFKVLADRDEGILDAVVVTARQLGEFEQVRLQTALEAFAKARLRIRYLVDPRVIGGVRFQCGDVLLDDTIRGRLDEIRQRLEAAALR